MANFQVETIKASGAETVTGTKVFPGEGYGPAKTLRAQLHVTAAGGVGPTLNVVIQDSLDGTNWNTIGTFAQLAAAGREVINVTNPFSEQLRVQWTIAGTTPTFTFSIVCASDPA